MKYVFSTIGLVVIFAAMIGLSSCNNGSSTTTLPGSWDKLGDFNGIPRSGAVSFVIDGIAYMGGGFNYEAVGQPATPTGRLNDFWKYDPSSDTWTQVASFPVPAVNARSNAVAFALNGKGYVGTGFDGTYAYNDFYEFDPTVGPKGKWTQVANFAEGQDPTDSARYGCIAFTVKNRAFVGAGHYISDLKDLWEFDPTQTTNGKPGAWIYRGSTGGSKRQNGFVMVINDIAYVGGGTDNGQYVKDFYKFSVDEVNTGNPWTALNGLTGKDANGNAIVQPRPRELASTFSIGNYGYLTCGSTNGPLNDTWQYDPSKDSWIQYFSISSNTPIAGSARSSACAFALTYTSSQTSTVVTRGFLTAGGSGNTKFDDCWIFNPVGVEPNNE